MNWFRSGNVIPFIIVISVASSVSLIMVNKAIMRNYHFEYVFTLTATHFLATWLGLSGAAQMGVFEPKSLPRMEMVKMATAGVGSIVFMNMSLRFNTVGTYQMLKLCCVPAVMYIGYRASGKGYSNPIKTSLGVLLLGVGIATVTDVALTPVGMFFGALSVALTAQFQVWQGAKQKQFSVSAFPLTHALAPYQFVVTMTCALCFEGAFHTTPIWSAPLSTPVLGWILLSACIAVSVNLCSMGLIGKTDAVTYQVVGHLKTCLILVLGYYLYPSTATGPQIARNILGVIVAMSGVFAYSYYKTIETQAKDTLPQSRNDK